MRYHFAAVALVVVMASVASAQDALTPTDVLEARKIAGTLRLGLAFGEGTLTDGVVELDLELDQIGAELELAYGLGKGFEVEMLLPFQFKGHTEGEIGGFTYETDEEGLGDLMLIGNYRLVEENPERPHIMGGAIVVFPTGDDDIAVPEFGATPGEEGGIGDGVFKLGLQAGLSRRWTDVEPYARLRFLFAIGEHEDNDVSIDVADVLSVMVGSEFHLSDKVKLDVRIDYQWVGDEVEEDDLTGAETTDEAHFELALQARGYFALGKGWTLTVGSGLFVIEDHAVDEEGGVDLEDAMVWSFEIGIHLWLDTAK